MSLQKIFVDNLKYYRSRQQISQAKLAEICGLSSGMIGKIESFTASPSFSTIEKISHALGIDPSLLFIDRSRPEQYKAGLYDDVVNDLRNILKTYGEEK